MEANSKKPSRTIAVNGPKRSVVPLDKTLVDSISRLKASFAAVQTPGSQGNVVDVLAECLTLTGVYGTDRPEFKAPVWNRDGRLEYSDAGVREQHHCYRPVVWQVFDGLPPDILDACASILVVVERLAEQKGVALADTSALAELMRSSPSIHCLLGVHLQIDPTKPRGAKRPGALKRRLRGIAESIARFTERRISNRIPVFISALLDTGDKRQDVTVLDVSPTGAKVCLSKSVGSPDKLTLNIPLFGRFRVRGVLSDDNTVGLRFTERFDAFAPISERYAMAVAT